jgi:hypothetical protein
LTIAVRGINAGMFTRLVPVATALLLISGVSTAACGSTGSDNRSNAEASASPSAKVPTTEELKKALLVLSDLPAGYTESRDSSTGGASAEPTETSSVASTSAECDQLFNEFGNEQGASVEQGAASAEFEKSATGPFVKQTVESYRDAGRLQQEMTKVREAVDKCGEFTVKDSEGEARVKVSNASFPKLGDETAAFKMEATAAVSGREVDLDGYLVAVRVGNVVTTIISFGLAGVDVGETEQIARKAVDKVTPIAR